ncbi:hypothetical protein ACVXHB_23745 [Escherichia coli]
MGIIACHPHITCAEEAIWMCAGKPCLAGVSCALQGRLARCGETRIHCP